MNNLPAELADRVLADPGNPACALSVTEAVALLTDASIDTMDLVHAAYRVRRAHWGRAVQVHILNNAQNGNCPEDCGYCSQARTSEADIEDYPLKPDAEVLEEARLAYEAGAHRYCMVFAGRGPNAKRTDTLARLVRSIKQTYPTLEVCVSAGLLDEAKAAVLKGAGLDRLNHNLNTSRETYPDICTTHTYNDRLETLRAAQRAGLGMCSGLIAGMGETPDELVEVAFTLRELGVQSIPVNFLLPFEGNAVDTPHGLTPAYCLRVLAMFRFVCPTAELRVAAGREFHLRSLEVLAMHVANSLFLDGYLNAKGAGRRKTLQMLADAGFEVVSDHRLDELLAAEDERGATDTQDVTVDGRTTCVKSEAELRPAAGSV